MSRTSEEVKDLARLRATLTVYVDDEVKYRDSIAALDRVEKRLSELELSEQA